MDVNVAGKLRPMDVAFDGYSDLTARLSHFPSLLLYSYFTHFTKVAHNRVLGPETGLQLTSSRLGFRQVFCVAPSNNVGKINSFLRLVN